MADTKISALPASTTPLAGTEVLPIVQSSTTKKVSVANLTSGRAVDMLSATVGPNALSLSGAVVDIGNDRNSATRVGISNQNTGASATAGLDLEAAGGGWQIDVPPDVVTFANPLIGKFGGTEKFRFLTTGSYKPIATAGVDYSANTGAAGKTSQLLNWYEEGTWTPSVGGNATYTAQSGYYTRIGNFVKLRFHLTINVLGTGSTTNISGMPFTPSSNDPSIVGGVVCYANNLAVAALSLGIYAQSDGLIRFFTRDTNSTGATTQFPAVIGNGFDVYAEISYQI